MKLDSRENLWSLNATKYYLFYQAKWIIDKTTLNFQAFSCSIGMATCKLLRYKLTQQQQVLTIYYCLSKQLLKNMNLIDI